ncbi:hypothetical protein [Microbulbifer sp. SSSA005]|uniref:hypothetical protein n=1 Tax=unclassified Microbulbifer TaxID=2619833 RepID=UPI00403ACF8D
MKHDPTTKEGREEIKRSLKKLRPEIEELKELAKKDVDNEPRGKLTNPIEIHVKRILKRNEDR